MCHWSRKAPGRPDRNDDPRARFPKIDAREDIGHAFYLGVETARAEIAFRLGKRYAQDEPLSFGVASQTRASAEETHLLGFKEAGPTRRSQDEESKN